MRPTSWRDNERKINKINALSSPKEKTSEVATNVYSRKMLEKQKKGLWILKRRVRELFTHREGISTPHARHKGWQPLIETAKCDFKIIYFPKSGELLFFYYFYFFRVDKGVVLAPMYLIEVVPESNKHENAVTRKWS